MTSALEETALKSGPDLRAAAERRDRWLRIILPVVILTTAVLGWEALVRIQEIPHYILPAPSLIMETLVKDWAVLSGSLITTLQITFAALAVAVAGGVGLAVLFTQSKWVEISFFPFAVILQVTPIIAIAPLILIYVDSIPVALLICAWIVAFFRSSPTRPWV